MTFVIIGISTIILIELFILLRPLNQLEKSINQMSSASYVLLDSNYSDEQKQSVALLSSKNILFSVLIFLTKFTVIAASVFLSFYFMSTVFNYDPNFILSTLVSIKGIIGATLIGLIYWQVRNRWTN